MVTRQCGRETESVTVVLLPQARAWHDTICKQIDVSVRERRLCGYARFRLSTAKSGLNSFLV